MNEELINIYGARPSKNGNGYNVTLIQGKDSTKRFMHLFVKNENTIIKDGYVYIKAKILEEKKEAPKVEVDDNSDCPF